MQRTAVFSGSHRQQGGLSVTLRCGLERMKLSSLARFRVSTIGETCSAGVEATSPGRRYLTSANATATSLASCAGAQVGTGVR